MSQKPLRNTASHNNYRRIRKNTRFTFRLVLNVSTYYIVLWYVFSTYVPHTHKLLIYNYYILEPQTPIFIQPFFHSTTKKKNHIVTLLPPINCCYNHQMNEKNISEHNISFLSVFCTFQGQNKKGLIYQSYIFFPHSMVCDDVYAQKVTKS